MKFLFVDDDPSLSEMMCLFFEKKDDTLVIADNADSAYDLIKNTSFDSIILHLAMPKVSGVDLIYRLNKDGLMDGKKIFVYTAAPFSEKDLNELIENGIVTWIRKPIPLSKLYELVSAA